MIAFRKYMVSQSAPFLNICLTIPPLAHQIEMAKPDNYIAPTPMIHHTLIKSRLIVSLTLTKNPWPPFASQLHTLSAYPAHPAHLAHHSTHHRYAGRQQQYQRSNPSYPIHQSFPLRSLTNAYLCDEQFHPKISLSA